MGPHSLGVSGNNLGVFWGGMHIQLLLGTQKSFLEVFRLGRCLTNALSLVPDLSYLGWTSENKA